MATIMERRLASGRVIHQLHYQLAFSIFIKFGGKLLVKAQLIRKTLCSKIYLETLKKFGQDGII